MAVPDADLDRLFALPLDQFVAERKRMARALTQAGQRDDARVLDKLPRPSVSAWAVNQVARRDPALVRRLGDLTERLRAAQGGTSHGAGPGGDDDLAAMTAEHRKVLGSLRDLVDQVLASAGNDASPQLLRRVITNLRAGVAAPETRPLVESGRLVRDVEEADFTTLFEALPPSGAASPGSRTSGRTPPPLIRLASSSHTGHSTHTTPTTPPAERAPAEAAARMTAERAEREARREREKARASAERRIVRLREAAAKARHALADEERAVAAARAALAAREEHLSHTRGASETAEAAVAELEAELARLERQS